MSVCKAWVPGSRDANVKIPESALRYHKDCTVEMSLSHTKRKLCEPSCSSPPLADTVGVWQLLASGLRLAESVLLEHGAESGHCVLHAIHTKT